MKNLFMSIIVFTVIFVFFTLIKANIDLTNKHAALGNAFIELRSEMEQASCWSQSEAQEIARKKLNSGGSLIYGEESPDSWKNDIPRLSGEKYR